MIRSMSINFKGHIIVKLMQPAKQHMRSTKYSIPVICILTNNTEIFIVCYSGSCIKAFKIDTNGKLRFFTMSTPVSKGELKENYH